MSKAIMDLGTFVEGLELVTNPWELDELKTPGEIFAKLSGYPCEDCPFRKKCNKLQKRLKKHDTYAMCHDLVDCMLGLITEKQIISEQDCDMC